MTGANPLADRTPPPAEGAFHTLEVAPHEAGERLDVYLHHHFPAFSRSALKRWIEDARVEVGGRIVRASRMLRAGERVSVTVPPPPPPLPIPRDIPLDVIYEDSSLLVILKPAGLVVHPGAGDRKSVV